MAAGDKLTCSVTREFEVFSKEYELGGCARRRCAAAVVSCMGAAALLLRCYGARVLLCPPALLCFVRCGPGTALRTPQCPLLCCCSDWYGNDRCADGATGLR